MTPRGPLVAVDLTPMCTGGEGGGNKIVALTVLRHFKGNRGACHEGTAYGRFVAVAGEQNPLNGVGRADLSLEPVGVDPRPGLDLPLTAANINNRVHRLALLF